MPFLSQENNSADGATLSRFIATATRIYPARKYALIIGSHGAGWKGLGRDIMSPGTRDYDRLYVPEFNGAIFRPGDGDLDLPDRLVELELVVFDACLMASIEVGRQISNIALYMVASEDTIPGDGIAYGSLVRSLAENSEENGESIGRRMLRHYRDRYGEGPIAREGRPSALSVIDLRQTGSLSDRIDDWGKWLLQVTPLIGARIKDPSDNVQLFIRQHAGEAQRFADNNFIDLRDFAERVRKDTRIPDCGGDRGAAMLEQLAKTVLQETHDERFPGANGLHIHFPLYRAFPGRLTPDLDLFAPSEPYDFPTTRLASGSDPYGAYGINRGRLPFESRDQEDGTPFSANESRKAPAVRRVVYRTAGPPLRLRDALIRIAKSWLTPIHPVDNRDTAGCRILESLCRWFPEPITVRMKSSRKLARAAWAKFIKHSTRA